MSATDNWKKHTESQEFRDSVQKYYQATIDELLDTKLSWYCDYLTRETDAIDSESWTRFFAQLASALLPQADVLFREIALERNINLAQRMENDTLQAWVDFFTLPVRVPPELVSKMVHQPAVEELFMNVIQSSIVNFNKKVNPLAGMMSGLDKQIKDFLGPFMPAVLDLVKSFLTDQSNSGLMQDFSGKLFKIAANEMPKDLASIETARHVQQAALALHKTIQDKTVIKNAKEDLKLYFSKVKRDYGNQTVREYFVANNVEVREIPLSPVMLEFLSERAAMPAFYEFLTRESAHLKQT